MNSRNSIGILMAVMALLAVMILLTGIWNHLAGELRNDGEITVALAIVATVLVFLLAVTAMVGARRIFGRPLLEMQAEIATTTRTLERLGQALRDHEARAIPSRDHPQSADSALRLSSLLDKLQGTLIALESIGQQTDSIVACINEVASQAHQVAQNAKDQKGQPTTSEELAELARQVKGLADRWSPAGHPGSGPPRPTPLEVETIVTEVRAGSRPDWPTARDPARPDTPPSRWKFRWPRWLRPW